MGVIVLTSSLNAIDFLNRIRNLVLFIFKYGSLINKERKIAYGLGELNYYFFLQ
jgi:hypothetical protein